MITSDKQYTATKEKLAMLEESLAKEPVNTVPDIIRETNEGQLQSLIAEVREEIKEYEKFKSTKLEEMEIHSIHTMAAI